MAAPYYMPYFNPDWLKPQENNNGFNIDLNSETANKIAGVAPAVIGAGAQWASMDDEASTIDTSAPEQQTDYTGAPVYNIGQRAIEASNIKPRGASAGEVLSSTGQLAAAGAKFGGVGALFGASIGLVGSLIGGGARKRAMRRAKRRAMANIKRAKTNYNIAQETSNMQRQSMQAYQDSINTQDRLQNLYS